MVYRNPDWRHAPGRFIAHYDPYQTYQTAQQTSHSAQQLAQATEQARLQAYLTGASQMAAIDSIFVEHPEMYPYFYEGREIAHTDSNYKKALPIAMAMANYLETSLPREGTKLPEWWERYMRDQFVLSPILCEYLERRQAWFDPRLSQIMREAKGDS